MVLGWVVAAGLAACSAAPAPEVGVSAGDATGPRFHLTTVGEGPDVVLIPGLASSAAVWDGTTEHLAKTHRVHVIQVAGFAGVPAGANASGPVVRPLAAALADWIDEAQLVRPVLVGHSMGGLVGLIVAEDRPASVGGLVVVDALPLYGLLMNRHATASGDEPRARAMQQAMLKGGEAAFRAQAPTTAARLVRTTGAARDAVAQAASDSDLAVVAQAFYDASTIDVREGLPRVACPTTVLYAWDSTMGYPAGNFDAMYGAAYAGLPGVELRRVDGSYHFLMIDQPTVFHAALDTFLAKR